MLMLHLALLNQFKRDDSKSGPARQSIALSPRPSRAAPTPSREGFRADDRLDRREATGHGARGRPLQLSGCDRRARTRSSSASAVGTDPVCYGSRKGAAAMSIAEHGRFKRTTRRSWPRATVRRSRPLRQREANSRAIRAARTSRPHGLIACRRQRRSPDIPMAFFAASAVDLLLEDVSDAPVFSTCDWSRMSNFAELVLRLLSRR